MVKGLRSTALEGYGTPPPASHLTQHLALCTANRMTLPEGKSKGQDAAVCSYDRGQRDPRRDEIWGEQEEKDSKW